MKALFSQGSNHTVNAFRELRHAKNCLIKAPWKMYKSVQIHWFAECPNF